MPRGKKTCPECKSHSGVRSLKCENCDHVFVKGKLKAKKTNSYFQERRDFIKRVLKSPPKNYAAEMVAVTKIFNRYKNDLDFLSKVKIPSFISNSLLWFLTPNGKEFLEKKYREFLFEPKKHEKPVDFKVKFGDDIKRDKPKTIRDFLNE